MDTKTIEIRLSIIIPFYNVEKYIAQCLESVYSQDIPENEYEVICVNDCSPDGTKNSIVEYQKRYENLILINHEVNKKQGAARNTGLRAARGKYVWFIDSDDYIKENVFRKLLEKAEENELEILHFNSQRVIDDGELSTGWYVQHTDTNVITGLYYLNDLVIPFWKKSVMAWSKLYLKDFLLQNKLFFPEYVFFEDNVQYLESLLKASRFQYLNESIYFWRINKNSIMHTNLTGGIKTADQIRYCCACLELLENYSEMPFYCDIKNTYLARIRHLGIRNILLCPLKEKILFYKRIKSFDRRILANQNVGRLKLRTEMETDFFEILLRHL
jgi:glycosyltransferase involved in cell wall biosynthesis